MSILKGLLDGIWISGGDLIDDFRTSWKEGVACDADTPADKDDAFVRVEFVSSSYSVTCKRQRD